MKKLVICIIGLFMVCMQISTPVYGGASLQETGVVGQHEEANQQNQTYGESQGDIETESPSMMDLVKQLASTNGGRFVLLAGATAWLIVILMYVNRKKRKKMNSC